MKTLRTLAATVALLLCCITASAYSFEKDGIYYYITNSTSLTVGVTYKEYVNGTYSSPYSGDVVIPATVTYNEKEYTVTSIGDYAFQYCSSLTSITIPEGVTSIGDYAFQYCSSLTEIHIASIESWLTISYGNWASNPNYAASNVKLYIDGEELTGVEIPSTVTSIPSYAFYNCSSLTSITLPEGVTSIGECTFYNCSSLTSMTIPASVTSIGDYAYDGCVGLKELTFVDGSETLSLGYSFYSIGNYVQCCGLFYYCPLEKLYLGRNLSYNAEYYSSNAPFYNQKGLTSVTVSDDVTMLGNYLFYGCTNISDIYVASVESWLSMEYADYLSHPNYYCENVNLYVNNELVSDVEVPSSITAIPDYAFRGCSSLTSITLPEGVTSIGDYAFQYCSSLTSITLPEGVTSIGDYAFQYCSSLTSITLPVGVTSIGNNAFYNCSSLTSMTIPEGVTSIGSNAFYNCSSLTSITLPEGVTSIGSNAFYNCSSLTSMTIPASVTSIGGYAYDGCVGLKELTFVDGSETLSLGNSSYYIGSYSQSCGLFYYCPLEKLYLGRNLSYNTEYYSSNAPFYNQKGLTSVTVSDDVTALGDYLFYSTSIKEVIMESANPATLVSASLAPSYTTFIVPTASYNDYATATYWADIATQITIDDVDARVKSVALTAEEDKSALHMAIGDENLKYVTNLTVSGTINSYDFMVMRNKMPLLRHLDLSEAAIVGNAYQHYTGYCTEDNKFPGYGLYNCNLLSLVLPKSITTIGSYAMRSNTNLAEVTFFEGLTSIGNYAFRGCSSLTSITLPEGVTSIGSYAFQYCSSLTSITLPVGVTSIGDYAFEDCSSLKSIILPPTVETIGSYAFQYCSSLTEIRIPSSVRSVDNYAFSGCSKLNDVYVYTVEPISIGQTTFTLDGNNFIGTLHAPKVSYWDYYYDTQWSQFVGFAEFDEPYDNFYVEGDKVLDNETGDIRGEEGDNPDAEMGDNSGIIVEDDVTQDLGDVDIEHSGTHGGSIIVGGEGHVHADKMCFRINVTGGRWYFFCFPFDIKKEDICLEGGAEWIFRYYDGEERAKNGKGGWKNVTSDDEGTHLKTARGYIFQCSKNDVLALTVRDKKIKKEDKYNELVAHVTENAHDASWNFVGNPHLSYYEITNEDYSAPITVWDGSKYIAIRPGDDDYQLAPFEAFFVQKPEGEDKVQYSHKRQKTYHQSQEAASQARARRRAQAIDPDRLLVNITLSDGTTTDQTRVVFNNEAAMSYETTCDAAKFSTAGVAQLYTIDSRAVKYAINERPVAEGIVTMGYTAPTQGNYTLAAPRMDTPIYIKDNLTGTVHNFAEGSYEFATEAGTFDDRFTVVMKAGETGIDNSEFSIQNSEIYNVKGQRVESMQENGVYVKENRKVIKL